jgi:hypothetical protein
MQLSDTMSRLSKRLEKIEQAKYEGNTKPLNPRQKLTDEQLIDIFQSVEGAWLEVKKFKAAMIENGKELIKVNDKNMKRSAINSSALQRMSKLTGKYWRQKRSIGENGEMLVKFYIDISHKVRRRKRKK